MGWPMFVAGVLLAWPTYYGVAWLLDILKEGPNEPTAGRTVTEPLDDPEVNQGDEAA